MLFQFLTLVSVAILFHGVVSAVQVRSALVATTGVLDEKMMPQDVYLITTVYFFFRLLFKYLLVFC